MSAGNRETDSPEVSRHAHLADEGRVLAMIRGILARQRTRLADRQVFLFGSRARGTARPRSDFDVGVLGREPMALRDFYAIEDDFEALPTLHTIDWVDFNRVDELFRQRAMRHTVSLT